MADPDAPHPADPAVRPADPAGHPAPHPAYPADPDGELDGADAAPAHGVGPWPGGPAAWPADAHYDPELLAAGDTRNVVDDYRYWRMEAIVADLDAHRHPFHVAIENWQHDMNIGSIVRSANGFGAAAVHIIGRRRWNRRGAMVTDRYQHVFHHEDVTAFAAWASEERMPLIAVDNVPGSVAVDRAELPERCVLVFGQEGPGLSAEALAAASGVVEIAQYGSTRSLNAAAAAAVVMYEWCRRWAR
ncbi:rRNA methyltransferase [Microbacterium sp. cx-55]|uniref:TrmH family RNA methyltransferase n=1 Tax=Microbacterium sp. cx-55 TaxID=2875948 RepID=UPI001CBE0740|nr:TrmH family RNA methyltransferase [Microbacterium sp. cx-55]MBZ4488400.1 rRNA methyltransferase [Microbacterium sp. cx-55]UGB35052.1 rRNA methyltransferase [Microbacterium sp. cx-55]